MSSSKMNPIFGLTRKEMKSIDCQVGERMESAIDDEAAYEFYSNADICVFTGVKGFYANVLRYRRDKFDKKADSRNWKMLHQAIYAYFCINKRLDEWRVTKYLTGKKHSAV